MKWTEYDSGSTRQEEGLQYLEGVWRQERRPYFNVWPSVILGLSRARLDIRFNQLVNPPRSIPPALLFRFPEKERVKQGEYLLDSFLFMYNTSWPYLGAFSVISNSERRCKYVMGYGAGSDDKLEEMNRGLLNLPNKLEGEDLDVPVQLSITAFRIGVGVLLMMEDPELVTPVVIKKDQAKYDATRDQKFVEKARRRGNIGWDVGKHLEVSPHYRRPHFGIRYKGKGEANRPVLVPIKGAIVHRDKLGKVPTGYLDDE